VADLIHDICDLPYTRKKESTIIKTFTGDFYHVYGEVVLNAFSRYETGKTKPTLALVKLL